MVSGNKVGFRHLRAAFQGQKCTPITIWLALRFQCDQINSLRNGRDSDLKQIGSNYRMQGHFGQPVLHVSKSFEEGSITQ